MLDAGSERRRELALEPERLESSLASKQHRRSRSTVQLGSGAVDLDRQLCVHPTTLGLGPLPTLRAAEVTVAVTIDVGLGLEGRDLSHVNDVRDRKAVPADLQHARLVDREVPEWVRARDVRGDEQCSDPHPKGQDCATKHHRSYSMPVSIPTPPAVSRRGSALGGRADDQTRGSQLRRRAWRLERSR